MRRIIHYIILYPFWKLYYGSMFFQIYKDGEYLQMVRRTTWKYKDTKGIRKNDSASYVPPPE